MSLSQCNPCSQNWSCIFPCNFFWVFKTLLSSSLASASMKTTISQLKSYLGFIGFVLFFRVYSIQFHMELCAESPAEKFWIVKVCLSQKCPGIPFLFLNFTPSPVEVETSIPWLMTAFPKLCRAWVEIYLPILLSGYQIKTSILCPSEQMVKHTVCQPRPASYQLYRKAHCEVPEPLSPWVTTADLHTLLGTRSSKNLLVLPSPCS